MKGMSAGERQPLLAHVAVAPTHPRYPRRQLFSRIVTFVLGAGLMYIALGLFFFPSWPPYMSDAVRATAGWYDERIPLETLEEIMLFTPIEDKAREWSQYYTAGPHLAGKNLSQAIWTKEKWDGYGIASEIVTYDIYTNYPVSHRLALLNASKSEEHAELLYEAALEEKVLKEDPTTALEDRIPTFHGYSANGSVTAEFIWANYGTTHDFNDLVTRGVDIAGKVVIVRYGHIFRGLKVKRAQELGAVGVVMYCDPGDDGEITEVNGYKPYPDGPARHKDSVQRGSVQFNSIASGDPTTPGYASKPGVPRQDPSELIPSIPSIPVSYADVLPFLLALNGHGISANVLNKYWRSGGLRHKGVKYNIGPAPGIQINLVNEVDYVITPQWDVIGKIEGYISDEAVILGNHRDAWVAGGAVDPNSGSAAFIELARTFGSLLQLGWKPARTVILASWDGEEYGLLGSTEWVEDHAHYLTGHALAYLNVDLGARSGIFKSAANPLLHDLIHSTLKKVPDPRLLKDGNTTSLHKLWNKRIATLGSGSDYAPFQDFLGIPCVDMGFSGSNKKEPVYHYHSNYDSFHWMETYGDSGFLYHAAMAKVWGLMALNLIESPIVPFNATKYAVELGSYLDSISKELPGGNLSEFTDAFTSLEQSVKGFLSTAEKFDADASDLSEKFQKPIPWWRFWERVQLLIAARATNEKYKLLDRAFVYGGGLDGRNLFKHVVYAPGMWTGYSGDTFPGIAEAVRDKDWANATRWANIVSGTVEKARKSLH